MSWHDVVAYFFGGVFLANFTPHFVAGVSGRAFQTWDPLESTCRHASLSIL